MDKDGRHLMDGGGTIVYGSNHGVVYAPGGLGILQGDNTSTPDIIYYHYRKWCRRKSNARSNELTRRSHIAVNTSIGFTSPVGCVLVSLCPRSIPANSD